MLKKRKATRDSLDELRKKMPVLSENQQRGCIGGTGTFSIVEFEWMMASGSWEGGYVEGFGFLCGMGTTGSFFNKNATIAHLNANALSASIGRCGVWVREALEAGDFWRTNHNLGSAHMWAGYLESRGVPTVPFDYNFQPRVGDIAVFGAVVGHPHGHIQMWNGQQWVSDFKQCNGNNENGFWVNNAYRNAGSGNVTIFRQ